MSYFIVGFSKDWADEFNARGSFLATEEEVAKFSNWVEEHGNSEFSIYFGTNEGWDCTVNEFISGAYTFHQINADEYETLKKYENVISGLAISFEDIYEQYEDSREWDDEE